ncbi:hypothetical protein acsn021_31440 [Anaerocolumna cellulosilytica]|uniref:Uncharacterized protein n=1 Tax=Anaerocolumna cellulosilytica TaxID=433286 RepID=A0A6S6R8R3_9FIRM|nr:hypothetical protein acsn021_31440 [Anaerocolumna cellulosilytica]
MHPEGLEDLSLQLLPLIQSDLVLLADLLAQSNLMLLLYLLLLLLPLLLPDPVVLEDLPGLPGLWVLLDLSYLLVLEVRGGPEVRAVRAVGMVTEGMEVCIHH